MNYNNNNTSTDFARVAVFGLPIQNQTALCIYRTSIIAVEFSTMMRILIHKTYQLTLIVDQKSNMRSKYEQPTQSRTVFEIVT